VTKHTVESRATTKLVRATYVLALVTLALVAVTALLVWRSAQESHHDNCPIVPTVVHERRIEE
jgi:hypothetical protein